MPSYILSFLRIKVLPILSLIFLSFFIISYSSATSKDNPTKERKIRFDPLVNHYVLVEKGDPIFFYQYCQKTGVEVQKLADHKWKAGPFLSGYEAAWLCGVTPYSHVIEEDSFEPCDKDKTINILKQAKIDLRWFDDASNLKTKKRVFDSYEIIRVDSSSDTIFYLKKGTKIKQIGVKEHWDYYQESFGVGLIDLDGNLYFLSVESGCCGTGTKMEFLRLWTFDRGIRLVLNDFKSMGLLLLHPQGEGKISCCRLFFVGKALKVQHITISLNETPAARAITDRDPIKANDWQGWKDKSHLPELVALAAKRPIAKEYEVYLIDPDIIESKRIEVQEQLSVLPSSIQSILYRISEKPWIDNLMIIELVKDITLEELITAINHYATFSNNHPADLETQYLRNIITKCLERPEISGNKDIKRAAIDVIEGICDFDEYVEYGILLCSISKIKDVKITIPEIKASFYFNSNNFHREGKDIDWNNQGALIKKKTMQWWLEHWN